MPPSGPLTMLRVRCISPSVLAVLFWGCFFVLFAAERAYPQDDATGVEVQGSSDDDQRFYDPLFDDELDQDPASFPDPWEGGNRGLMGFNRRRDRWLLGPLTRGYPSASVAWRVGKEVAARQWPRP